MNTLSVIFVSFIELCNKYIAKKIYMKLIEKVSLLELLLRIYLRFFLYLTIRKSRYFFVGLLFLQIV